MFLLVFLVLVFSAYGERDVLNCNNVTPGNLWQDYVCDLLNNETKVIEAGCLPRSYSPIGLSVKGAILLYHGYTACPDSMDPLAERLASNGFHVYIPLTIGHGRKFNESCSSPENICVNGDPIDELPTHPEQYTSYVARTISMFKQELSRLSITNSPEYAIGTGGLSLGGALATNALIQDAGSTFNRGVIMNPFFGLTSPTLDQQVQDCLGPVGNIVDFETCMKRLSDKLVSSIQEQAGFANSTDNEQRNVEISNIMSDVLAKSILQVFDQPNDLLWSYQSLQNLVRFMLTKVALNPSVLASLNLSSIMEVEFGWGEECILHRYTGRFGYCSFRLRNLFAVHAFGQQNLAQAYKIPVPLQHILVERDGLARNSQAMYVAQSAAFNNDAESSVCIYTIDKKLHCEGNNCGVPHSFLSRAENIGVTPFELYWEDDLHQNVADFMSNLKPAGVSVSLNSGRVNASDCVMIDNILFPPEELFGQVPTGAILSISIIDTTIDGQNISLTELGEALTRRLGFSYTYLINFVENQILDAFQKHISEELRIEFAAYQLVQRFISHFLDGGFRDISTKIQINGVEIPGNTVLSSNVKTKGENDNLFPLVITATVASVATILLAVAVRKIRKEAIKESNMGMRLQSKVSL